MSLLSLLVSRQRWRPLAHSRAVAPIRMLASSPPPPDSSGPLGALRSALSSGWQGIRTLYFDVQKARVLTRRSRSTGTPLSWPDKQFVAVTRSNVMSLVPFLIFVSAPGSLPVLPIVIGIYPNFIPTVFQTPQMKISRQVSDAFRREALAERVLEVLETSARNILGGANSPTTRQVDALTLLSSLRWRDIARIKQTQSMPAALRVATSKEYLSEFVKLHDVFERCLPLEALSPSEQRVVARFEGVRSFPLGGVSERLHTRVDDIYDDDLLLLDYGLEKLTDDQLIGACQRRGVPTLHIGRDAMLAMLRAWLTLSSAEPKPKQALYHSAYCALLQVLVLQEPAAEG